VRRLFHAVWVAATNCVFYPVMVAWTICGVLLFPIALPVWKVATRWDSGRVMRHFIWIYGRVWMFLTFPFLRITPARFPGTVTKPGILVVNHLSFLDTYVMGALPFSDVVFAVRAWPFRMFWYAPFMRLAQYLNVEEMGWEGCLEACRHIFASGAYVLFFPEGHRSKDGKMHRFYSGPFKLAVETGVPVIPLCITGTDTVLPPSRHFVRPAKVRLDVLPPVYPAAFSGPDAHAEMRKFVKRQMADHLSSMRIDPVHAKKAAR
jgi:1-acyl-sn-glycerol-3-phosphate acyltransferase